MFKIGSVFSGSMSSFSLSASLINNTFSSKGKEISVKSFFLETMDFSTIGTSSESFFVKSSVTMESVSTTLLLELEFSNGSATSLTKSSALASFGFTSVISVS